jgi:hypothetical protein
MPWRPGSADSGSSEPAFPYRYPSLWAGGPVIRFCARILCQNRLRGAPSLLGDGEETFRSKIALDPLRTRVEPHTKRDSA